MRLQTVSYILIGYEDIRCGSEISRFGRNFTKFSQSQHGEFFAAAGLAFNHSSLRRIPTDRNLCTNADLFIFWYELLILISCCFYLFREGLERRVCDFLKLSFKLNTFELSMCISNGCGRKG